MPCYSWFWLAYAAGTIHLSPAWTSRDALDADDEVPCLDALENMPMAAWLRLDDTAHMDVVAGYAPRRQLRIRHAA